ncbi:MAG: hypothetical protein KME13_11500 [Myxacorys californica WJT36-NPBG1]|nr:hypothetical protein [Myxacorys californica WJT36-NPBG1]
MKSVKLLKSVVFSSAIALTLAPYPSLASQPKVGCTFSSQKSNLRDKCSFSSSGRLSRFIPKSVTLDWSDRVRTKIEVLTVESLHMGVAKGTAKVDGSDATYTMASDSGMCFKISKNNNSICYR